MTFPCDATEVVKTYLAVTGEGFKIETDEYRQPSATCPCCGAWRMICARCLDVKQPAEFRLEPPWGSSDARADIRVCLTCYRRLINAVRREAGLPAHEPT